MHSVLLMNILGTNWSAIFLVLHEDDCNLGHTELQPKVVPKLCTYLYSKIRGHGNHTI